MASITFRRLEAEYTEARRKLIAHLSLCGNPPDVIANYIHKSFEDELYTVRQIVNPTQKAKL